MRANVKNVRACRLKAEEVATWMGGALAMLSMLFLCTEDSRSSPGGEPGCDIIWRFRGLLGP